MSNNLPRTVKAEITGATRKNPERYKAKPTSTGSKLGPPSSFLSAAEKQMWRSFATELPWLVESDRALIEIAITLRSKLQSREPMRASELHLLRGCLVALGPHRQLAAASRRHRQTPSPKTRRAPTSRTSSCICLPSQLKPRRARA